MINFFVAGSLPPGAGSPCSMLFVSMVFMLLLTFVVQFIL